MKKGVVIGLVIGFCIGIAVLPLCAFVFIELGCAPVAVSSSPLPFEKWAAHTAMKARIAREAPTAGPIQATETNLVAGAEIYQENCAGCHGTMTHQSPMAQRMFPHPPALVQGKGVTDDPPGYTYWKAANGIRLSGMPSFGDKLSTTQLWQVSEMLAHANDLPPAATNILSRKKL